MVISPHSIFASLLREQFQPAIFKRVDNDACDHPLRIRSARMEGPTTFRFVFTEWAYTA